MERARRRARSARAGERAPSRYAGGPPDTFFDVVSGANGYGRRPVGAAPGCDGASGLGVPRFDRLAAALTPPAPALRQSP